MNGHLGRFWLALLLAGLILGGLTACQTTPSAPRPGTDKLLYEDAFVPGEAGRWLIEADNLAWSAIVNEQMVIAVDAPNLVQYAALDGQTFSDFVLEVDATLVDGNPESSYGVLFRMAGPQQFYRFEVTGNGLYAVERYDGGDSWTRLTAGWVESPAISQGLGGRNHLRLEANGATLTFAVNGEPLDSFSDTAYAAGGVALDAGTFARPGVQVAFDNLVIYRP